MTAAVKSREDHGYILEIGISDVSGFLSFKDADPLQQNRDVKLPTGALFDVTITKVSANGRICTLSRDSTLFVKSAVSIALNSFVSMHQADIRPC